MFLRARESPLPLNIYAGHKKINILDSTVLTVGKFACLLKICRKPTYLHVYVVFFSLVQQLAY